MKTLGASIVLDYKSPDIVKDFRVLGLFKYMYTTSGDAVSQQDLSDLLQPGEGRFAPILGDVKLPQNVERI